MATRRGSAIPTCRRQAKLKQLYGSKANCVRQFEQLTEAERAGWSLPVYHDLILADAKGLNF